MAFFWASGKEASRCENYTVHATKAAECHKHRNEPGQISKSAIAKSLGKILFLNVLKISIDM